MVYSDPAAMKLSIRDAARYLEVDEDTVYRWVRDGELPSMQINEQYRLNSSDLLEWATARGHRLSADLLEATREELPDLADALAAGGAHTFAGAPDRAAVLQAIVGALAIEEAERSLVLELVTAREFIGSTGVGEGIAIPHVRMPLIVHGVPGAMPLWHLPRPVDFQSPDGKPIDTVFFLMTSSPRVHLHLLARLARALHDPAFRAAVKERAPLETVLAEARRIDAATPVGRP